MGDRQETAMKAKSKVDAVLTNYDISFVFSHADGEYHFRQVTCDKGTFFELKGDGHEIDYIDFVKKTGYQLDAGEKRGESFPLDPIEAYKGLAFHTAGHLLFMHVNENEKVKVGSEKLLGRETTVYTRECANGIMKFWIDKEYGLALKYEQVGECAMKMYVTKFKVGGVTVDGLINLGEYKIE